MGASQSCATISSAGARLSSTASLDSDVSTLRYVSAARADVLRKLGIQTVRDLLLHVPHRYLDFTQVLPIAYADMGAVVTVVGRVDKIRVKRPRPRMLIVEASIIDETGVLMASFFKQPWVADQIHEGDTLALSGKIGFFNGFKQMSSPFFEVLSQTNQQGSFARVLPVHHTSEGISVAWMRRILSAALADRAQLVDWMDQELLAELGLMSEARALREVHFPASLASAEQARRRLAYDELLLLQLALLTRQRLMQKDIEVYRHVADGQKLQGLKAALPFSLTDEQEAATCEILADMAAPFMMNRLLLGDVGTGKTAVAALAMAACADTHTQAALMAPTSVLATQHAEKLGPLFDKAGIRWALILGSTPEKERSEQAKLIREGSIDVVFGTTALLSSDITFNKLSLVVIDEQHRFGTAQRAELRSKGAGADLLTMTATPIPRTLALSIYGDLSCSRIRKRPRAGAGISTQVIAQENLDIAYGAIREAHAAGQQIYVVCPLIDEADKGQDMPDDTFELVDEEQPRHAATKVLKELSEQVFPDMRCALITGRMSQEEKDVLMADFRAHKTDLLVSTTVIEVGVDVPNATVMLIYDADRFGLATLHQLRGRVGRGDTAGMVYLETSAKKESLARRRLSAVEQTSDGFELAELDLRLRREGEILGYKQSGGISLKLSDMDADADLIEHAHVAARTIYERDPDLTSARYAPLAFEAHARFGAYYQELEGTCE